MRAGKAYISSLGTTGVLIASSLLLLTVVGALVAFDRWPTQADAEPHTVPVTAASPNATQSFAPARAAGALTSGALDFTQTLGAAAELRGTADVAARVGRGEAVAEIVAAAPVADPIVSALPAPEVAPPEQQAPAAAAPPARPGSPQGSSGTPLPPPPEVVEDLPNALPAVDGVGDSAPALDEAAPADDAVRLGAGATGDGG